jgi:hypothetical protein
MLEERGPFVSSPCLLLSDALYCVCEPETERRIREDLVDVAKYLLTRTAVDSFLTSNLKVVAALIACAASKTLILIAH